jgi:hypothetical protein
MLAAGCGPILTNRQFVVAVGSMQLAGVCGVVVAGDWLSGHWGRFNVQPIIDACSPWLAQDGGAREGGAETG